MKTLLKKKKGKKKKRKEVGSEGFWTGEQMGESGLVMR